MKKTYHFDRATQQVVEKAEPVVLFSIPASESFTIPLDFVEDIQKDIARCLGIPPEMIRYRS